MMAKAALTISRPKNNLGSAKSASYIASLTSSRGICFLAADADRSATRGGRVGDRALLRRGRGDRDRHGRRSASPAARSGELCLADQRRAVGVLFRVGAQLFQGLAVGALAESGERLPVGAALDDRFADIRARRRRRPEDDRGEECGHQPNATVSSGLHRLG